MKNSVLDRLKSYFDEYFLDATKPTARNLFLVIVSILTLDIFRSVRFTHRHVLSKLSGTSLNAYYYALKTDRLEQAKLEIAAGMVRRAMGSIDPDRQVFLLCDSWYPKGCVAGLVDEYDNLGIICNARIDTVMYGLPPERTGKRGRPKKYGERLSPEDFGLVSPKTGDWKIGVRPVLTRLWGGRMVYAIVTLPKSGNGSRRLFFCTKNPENIILDYSRCEDGTICGYGEENVQFLPLACYSLRWNIEKSYYESKTFWSLEEYRVRSRGGIERLVNLECIAYSAMTLLPYSDESFSCYQSASAQDTRFGIGQQIQASIIFSSFVGKLETVKKACPLIKIVECYILSGFKNVKNL